MKRLAVITSVVLLTLMGVWVLWQFRGVVVLFVLSLAVAAALRPFVDRQVALGWSRTAALVFVYALALALGFVIVWSVGGPLLADLRTVADRFVLAYDQLWATWPTGTDFQQAVVTALPPPEDLYAAIAGPRGEAALQGLLGVTLSLFDLLGNAAIVLVMSLYWGADQARFERLWLSALPAEARARAREIWRAIETGVGAYIRSEFTQSLLAGMLLGLGYWGLGLPYPTLLAVVSALVWLVPWLGAALALLPVLSVAWMLGPVVALLAGIFTVLVFVVLEFVVEPRLYNRRQYSALLVVFTLLALGQAFGLLGVLAAAPLAAAVQILVTHLTTPASTPAAQPIDDQFLALEERLTSVRALLARSPEPPEPQAASLVDRLEALIDAAGEVLQAEGRLSRTWVSPKVRTLDPAPQ
jgi:predicted PurR-regulated permease PerM